MTRLRETLPGGKTFEHAYQSRYHTHIELHAPFAYDATRVLVAAMEKADSVEPSDYLPALRAISYSGVTGQIAFDKEGNLKSPSFTVYKVVDGKWQPQTVLGGAKAK